MSKANELDEKVRALRKELADRTINLTSRAEHNQNIAGDSPYVQKVGKKISQLIYEERLEEARERLEKVLSEHPEEPGFLNLQMALNMLDKPFGNYDQAKINGSILMKVSVEKDNSYYTMMTLNNMGLIAHNEGHDEYSKLMYLAAHFIDKTDLVPLANLAGWCSRRNQLEEAQNWIDRIIKAYPNWLEKENVKIFFKKDESLHNLRSYKPYKDKVLSKMSEELKR